MTFSFFCQDNRLSSYHEFADLVCQTMDGEKRESWSAGILAYPAAATYAHHDSPP